MQQHDAIEQALRLLQQHASAQAAAGPPPIGGFRLALGVITGALTAVFLIGNMIVLGHFGYRLGNSEVEHYVQAACAAAVPVFTTLFPVIAVATWTPGHMAMIRGRYRWRRGRPKWGMLLGNLTALLIALSINFAGGIGVMSTARKQVQLAARDAKRDDDRLTFRRDMLAKEIGNVPQHRPVETVISMLAAHRLHRFWKATDQCNEGSVLSKAHRDYCAEHEKLKAEQSAGERTARLKTELATLDEQLASPARSTLQAEDAQVETIATSLGLGQDTVRNGLSLLFPVLLEIMTLIGTGSSLYFFRIDHRSIQDVPPSHEPIPTSRRLPPAEPSHTRRLIDALADEPPPVALKPIPLGIEDPTRQRAVFDEFWARNMRRVQTGQTPEGTVYTRFQGLCGARGVADLPLDTFRRMSASAHGIQYVEVAGQNYWLGWICEG